MVCPPATLPLSIRLPSSTSTSRPLRDGASLFDSLYPLSARLAQTLCPCPSRPYFDSLQARPWHRSSQEKLDRPLGRRTSRSPDQPLTGLSHIAHVATRFKYDDELLRARTPPQQQPVVVIGPLLGQNTSPKASADYILSLAGDMPHLRSMPDIECTTQEGGRGLV